MIPLTLLSLASAFVTPSKAAPLGAPLYYTYGETKMEGYLATPPTRMFRGKMPAILIVHDWMGLGDQAREKADALAHQGYVALAADIYGKGVRPKDSKEAGELATKYKSNRTLLRGHIRAAYDALIATGKVNADKIVVMGYCFGGTTALELARSGAKLAGTASFHGGLSTPNVLDAKNITSPVLVMHGADDPNVPPSEVDAFKEEMKTARVPLIFVAYPGAVHSFTNPKAGNDNSKGAAYNAEADKKSWAEFQAFLKRTLGK